MQTHAGRPHAVEAAPGFHYLINYFGEQYLHAINGQTFARCASASVYQTCFTADLFAENMLYVFVGTDGGLLPAYLNTHETPSGSRYVFIELEEILPLLAEQPGAASWPEAFHFATLADWATLLQEQQLPEYAYNGAVTLIPSLAVTDNYYSGYRELWRSIETSLRQQLWEFSVQLTSKVFFRRQLENLAENLIPAALLRNSCAGLTAVVLAGGPSLTEFLPWVTANRERLLVIAVSRISRLLLSAGIQPDIVVSVDPNPISFDVSKEMLDFDRTLLVNGYHITPLLSGNYRGRSVYSDSAIPWKVANDNFRSVGPTVTNTALHLAQDLGCKTIVLLGVDLCYSPEGYSHAQGSIEHSAGPLVGYIGQSVTTNGGALAETDPPFLHATKALTLQARRAEQLGCRLINPAVNAAAIAGIACCGLDDLVLPAPPRPIHEILDAALPELTIPERRSLYQSRLQDLQQALDALEQIRRICRSALTMNARLHSRRNPRFKRKLDKLEQQLNGEDLLLFSRFCKIFASERFTKVLATTEVNTWTDEFVEANARAYYEAYIGGADAFAETLRDAQDRLHVRLEELQPQPDWDRLASRWIKDGQCGRLLLWQQRFAGRSDTRGPAADLERELAHHYQRLLDGTDGRHLKVCQQRARLSGVIGKANEHLENKDLAALERLISGLLLRPEPEALPLAALCRGYAAELSGDLDAAVAAYSEIDQGPAVEFALIRLTGIALAREDYQHALLALEHLTNCSVAYAPQYAELLKLTGKPLQAVDVYTAYLTLAPKDLVAMTRLGLLYQELNISEGAEWIFDHLRKQEHAAPTAPSIRTAPGRQRC